VLHVAVLQFPFFRDDDDDRSKYCHTSKPFEMETYTEDFVLSNFNWHPVDQAHLASYVTDIHPKVQQQICFMTYPCDGPDPNNQAAVMIPGRQVLVLSMMISSTSLIIYKF
jgi:hypothetical protein